MRLVTDMDVFYLTRGRLRRLTPCWFGLRPARPPPFFLFPLSFSFFLFLVHFLNLKLERSPQLVRAGHAFLMTRGETAGHPFGHVSARVLSRFSKKYRPGEKSKVFVRVGAGDDCVAKHLAVA
jgi:hypothetical protein